MIEKVEELKQVEGLQNFYYTSKFDDCIQMANTLKDIKPFPLYQKVQLYKSLSLIEQGNYHQGFDNLEQLTNEAINQKGDKIEEIDLIIFTFWQWELYFYNSTRAELQNQKLKIKCDDFVIQNQHEKSYNHGVYLFAYGSYLFFENLRRSGKKESIDLLKKACNLMTEYEQDILILISFMYNEEDNFEQTIEYLTKLLAINPLFPGIYNYFAILYEKKQENKVAEEYYFKALELLPKNTIIMNNIALFYWNTGNHEKSEEFITKSYEINPQSAYTCFVYGSILNEQKNTEKAIQIFKQGIKYDSMDCEIFYELFKIEYEKQNFVKCIQILEQCSSINPLDGLYPYEIGRIYEENQSYLTAEKYLKQALQLKINDFTKVGASLQLANSFFKRKLYFEALQQYLETLNLNVDKIDMKFLFLNASYIINNKEFLSDGTKVNLINSCNRGLLQRLDTLIQKVTNNKISSILKFKLDNYQQVLMIHCYQVNVQPYLAYKNEISHWDLYFD